ncbi:MAG: hypothetical protein ABI237_00855 [Ginsengibacter sp.]
MLDLILLIFLARDIGRIAARKGLKHSTWKIYTVASWLIAEVLGLIVGVIIFGPNNLFSIIMVAITFAITSYFIIKAQLGKLPDQGIDDDINNIGQNH